VRKPVPSGQTVAPMVLVRSTPLWSTTMRSPDKRPFAYLRQTCEHGAMPSSDRSTYERRPGSLSGTSGADCAFATGA
jgi:hypothetical protein